MERNESGQFQATHDVKPRDILEFLDNISPNPVTTGEIARSLDAPRRTVFDYLCDLEKATEGLQSRKPNERLTLWWYE